MKGQFKRGGGGAGSAWSNLSPKTLRSISIQHEYYFVWDRHECLGPKRVSEKLDYILQKDLMLPA